MLTTLRWRADWPCSS